MNTPTPWKNAGWNGIVGLNGERVLLSSFGLSGGEECEDNDAFILRAVNSHAELIEALKQILEQPLTEWQCEDIAREALKKAGAL